jgi:hypothetical protein
MVLFGGDLLPVARGTEGSLWIPAVLASEGRVPSLPALKMPDVVSSALLWRQSNITGALMRVRQEEDFERLSKKPTTRGNSSRRN